MPCFSLEDLQRSFMKYNLKAQFEVDVQIVKQISIIWTTVDIADISIYFLKH
jgi:hypothetical protein